MLKEKLFPSSDIIRLSKRFFNKYNDTSIRNELSYTPEPDIFQEIFGHSPFLLNENYAYLMEKIGELGCEIIFNSSLTKDLRSHNLKRLQNFVWWTLEFGLVKTDNDLGFDIYGAGILSSYHDIQNVISSIKNNKNILPYSLVDVGLTRFDYSNLQDRYYYINSFDELIDDFENNKEFF